MRSRTTALAAAALLLSGCGSQTGSDPRSLGSPAADAGKGEARLTSRAVAAVALVHLPDDTSSRRATYTTYANPPGTVGADLRFDAEPGDDGDLVSVLVTTDGARWRCASRRAEHCEEREVTGGTLVLSWSEKVPEEDPGAVSVAMVRDDEVVAVGYSGPAIEADPREVDLPIPLETLEAVAQDPRLSLLTDQDVVDAGEQVADWEGGEAPDTADPTPVPASGAALAGVFLSYSGVTDFSGKSRSRVLEPFGAGAVGAHLSRAAFVAPPYHDVDVVVSPQPPTWLADDPCRSAGFACASYDGALGPQHLLWSAGRQGEAWLVNLRENEVVALRLSGWRVPEDRSAVEREVQVDRLRRLLDDDVHLGLTSTRGMENVRF